MSWTHPLRLDAIGHGQRLTLEPDAAQRAALARELDLQALDSLSGEVSLAPFGAGWRLTGRVRAEVVQTCGLSLEPVPATIDAPFQLDLIEQAEDDASAAIDLDPNQPDDPDVVEGGVVDLAAYVVEHLSLALDPFPRKPGAEFRPPETEAEPSPFAVLERLKPRGEA